MRGINMQAAYDFVPILYNAGLTQKAISRFYGVSQSVINKTLKRLGVVCRPPGTPNLTGARIGQYIDQVIEMYESGIGVRDIAFRYKFSMSTVCAALKSRNVATRSSTREWERIADKTTQHRVYVAIRTGHIQRPNKCETCGKVIEGEDASRKLHAHHCDYNKSYDVMWLCSRCHAKWHQANSATPRSERGSI